MGAQLHIDVSSASGLKIYQIRNDAGSLRLEIYRQSPTFLSLTKKLILVISMQIWTLLINPNHLANISVTVFSILTKVN